MTTYIVSVRVPSERARKYHGNPYSWRGHVKYRGRLPSDKVCFHRWILNMIHQAGFTEGTFKVVRPQSFGESAGFKLCAYGYVDDDHVEITRFHEESGDEHKAIPGQSWTRQPYYQSERRGFARTRFGRIRKPRRTG